jgi:hypothetical protein
VGNVQHTKIICCKLAENKASTIVSYRIGVVKNFVKGIEKTTDNLGKPEKFLVVDNPKE